jgi:hypothetical protein
MGGKSRKSGGVSKRLISKLKAEYGGTNNKCGTKNPKNESNNSGLFDLESVKKD